MEDLKRIRLVFKDDDILSETQKLDGLKRSWLLLKPQQHQTVSCVASHLIHTFQLHQSCPHGLLLSISGFGLPPFESSCILKDHDLIRVQKRRDILAITGNNAATDVDMLKVAEKQPVNTGVFLLANDEFEKRKSDYESNDPEEDDESLLKNVEDPSCSRPLQRLTKEKQQRNLVALNMKKKRSESTEDIVDDVHMEKNEKSILDGGRARKKRRLLEEEKNESSDDDNVEKNEETAELNPKSQSLVPGITGNDKIQATKEDIEDGEFIPKKTKKGPSRSSRRKAIKRQWLKAMAKLQKENATCESEGRHNWKEDQAKIKRKTIASKIQGQKHLKTYQANAERNEVDAQPKGLLHWKQSPQENWSFKSKKRHGRNQDGNFPKQQNQNGGVLEQSPQNAEAHEQPNVTLDDTHGQLGEINGGVQEQTKQNIDAPKSLNVDSDEENEVVPIVIRPGHIRFEPLGKDQPVQQTQTPPGTFQWNGITSKKKGQQWGKENRSFTPRSDYKSWKKEDTEIVSNENEKQSELGPNFNKLPPLTNMPKEGDLIAYRVVELSSTWTPEISDYRVGKVSWCDVGSNQLMLVPVPEYPIVSKKVDDEVDEAVQLDNSLYKEDGSLEIDFSSLIDAKILENGSSGAAIETFSELKEGCLGSENTAKALPASSSDKQAVEPRQESNGVDMWEQLEQTLCVKKKQLVKESWLTPSENSWDANAKAVVPSTKSGKNAGKLQSSRDNAHNTSGGYKGLRGRGLGPTMAILRSKEQNI